jgi:hypothetical protein
LIWLQLVKRAVAGDSVHGCQEEISESENRGEKEIRRQ